MDVLVASLCVVSHDMKPQLRSTWPGRDGGTHYMCDRPGDWLLPLERTCFVFVQLFPITFEWSSSAKDHICTCLNKTICPKDYICTCKNRFNKHLKSLEKSKTKTQKDQDGSPQPPPPSTLVARKQKQNAGPNPPLPSTSVFGVFFGSHRGFLGSEDNATYLCSFALANRFPHTLSKLSLHVHCLAKDNSIGKEAPCNLEIEIEQPLFVF